MSKGSNCAFIVVFDCGGYEESVVAAFGSFESAKEFCREYAGDGKCTYGLAIVEMPYGRRRDDCTEHLWSKIREQR